MCRRFARRPTLHGVSAEPDLNAMLRIPGVMSAESSVGSRMDAAALEAAVMAASWSRCCAKLNEVRAQEGAALAAELRASMVRLREFAEEVASCGTGCGRRSSSGCGRG